jgi:hypothetical protein
MHMRKKSVRERLKTLRVIQTGDEAYELSASIIHLLRQLEGCSAKKLEEDLFLFLQDHNRLIEEEGEWDDIDVIMADKVGRY